MIISYLPYSMFHRTFSTLSKNRMLKIKDCDVFRKSILYNIDFKVCDNSNAMDAAVRFAIFKLGTLAVVDKDENVTGMFSERSLIQNISKWQYGLSTANVSDMCFQLDHKSVVNINNTIGECYDIAIDTNSRDLLVVDDNDKKYIGIIELKRIHFTSNNLFNKMF